MCAGFAFVSMVRTNFHDSKLIKGDSAPGPNEIGPQAQVRSGLVRPRPDFFSFFFYSLFLFIYFRFIYFLIYLLIYFFLFFLFIFCLFFNFSFSIFLFDFYFGSYYGCLHLDT